MKYKMIFQVTDGVTSPSLSEEVIEVIRLNVLRLTGVSDVVIEEVTADYSGPEEG